MTIRDFIGSHVGLESYQGKLQAHEAAKRRKRLFTLFAHKRASDLA